MQKSTAKSAGKQTQLAETHPVSHKGQHLVDSVAPKPFLFRHEITNCC
jgi:hypothetical protein